VLKVQHKPIKISKLGFKRKEQKETEENPSLAHRTVRCVTGECPVPQGRSTPTLHLRVSGEPLRYNSPDCPVGHRTVRWAIGLSGGPSDCPVGHRTVRWAIGLSGVLAEQRLQHNGPLQRTPAEALQCANSSRRVIAAPEGAPDSEQYLSGAAPDCPVPQDVRAPTVETVRTLTVG
jgi:hypothetical protein